MTVINGRAWNHQYKDISTYHLQNYQMVDGSFIFKNHLFENYKIKSRIQNFFNLEPISRAIRGNPSTLPSSTRMS